MQADVTRHKALRGTGPHLPAATPRHARNRPERGRMGTPKAAPSPLTTRSARSARCRPRGCCAASPGASTACAERVPHDPSRLPPGAATPPVVHRQGRRGEDLDRLCCGHRPGGGRAARAVGQHRPGFQPGRDARRGASGRPASAAAWPGAASCCPGRPRPRWALRRCGAWRHRARTHHASYGGVPERLRFNQAEKAITVDRPAAISVMTR